jgi:hypothetical protein
LGYKDLEKWINETKAFSETQRHYKNLYLEICEDKLEVNLFSSEVDSYEIYCSYGRLHEIIYAVKENAKLKYDEVKKELEQEYRINKEPTDTFVNKFWKKYELCYPSDIFFDFKL